MGAYDPFAPGPFPVVVRTEEISDEVRGRVFPCEIWSPDGPTGLILFSHHSGGNRTSASYLCKHLSSHGYTVAALDHSEVVAPELGRKANETADQLAERVRGWIESRVPDLRLLLDYMLRRGGIATEAIGVVGHSFGGWTVLAAPDVEPRIRAVVALAPGGASNPKPGILELELKFEWGRDVPTLLLAAENDISLPLPGIMEIFERVPAAKRLAILRRADHMHFLDDVERQHEAVRAMTFSGELAWITKEMRPIAELCSGEQAHLFVRGLTLAHMDAVLRGDERAKTFLAGDLDAELATRGVETVKAGTPRGIPAF